MSDPTQPGAEDVAPRRARAWSPEASDEAAEVARTLMVRPWLLAGRDDAAIAKVKRNATGLTALFARLGWKLSVEAKTVRLHKSPPPRLAAWAADGPSPATCSWFFLLLAAAEAVPTKVALGDLVTAARHAAAEAGLPTTGDLPERRAIVNALKLADARGLIERLDGEVEEYLHRDDAPVLLEVHHTRLLLAVANPGVGDPATDTTAWLATTTREPDPARRMRRRLVDDTWVHTADLDDAEAQWLSRRLRRDDGGPLATAFGLYIERRAEGAAFVVPDEAFRWPHELGPRPFPTPGTVGHATILLLDTAAAEGTPDPDRPGWVTMPASQVLAKLTAWAKAIGAGRGGWAAEDAADPAALGTKVAALLTGLDLARLDDTDPGAATWAFAPLAGRWETPPNSAYSRHRTTEADQ